MSSDYTVLDHAETTGGDPRVYITNKVNEYPLVTASVAALGVVLAIIMIYRWWKSRPASAESLTTPTGMSWAMERSDYGGRESLATGNAASGQRTATVGGGMGDWAVSESNCTAAVADPAADQSAWGWQYEAVGGQDTEAAENMAARPQNDDQFSRSLAGY